MSNADFIVPVEIDGTTHQVSGNRNYYHFCVALYVTCSAIWGLLDKDDDLRASHELLNTERTL